MKEVIKEAKDILSEKYNLLTKQQKDESLTHEFEQEKLIRERKENPTVKEKLHEMTFKASKNMHPSVSPRGLEPDTQSREDEMASIRKTKAEKDVPAKDTSKQKSNTSDEIAAVIENVSNHSREAVQTVHDFVGGESRSQQLSYVRQRKSKSRGIER